MRGQWQVEELVIDWVIDDDEDQRADNDGNGRASTALAFFLENHEGDSTVAVAEVGEEKEEDEVVDQEAVLPDCQVVGLTIGPVQVTVRRLGRETGQDHQTHTAVRYSWSKNWYKLHTKLYTAEIL